MNNSNANGGSKLSLTKLDKERPEDVLGYAALYAGMGLSVIPNSQGRKKPTVKGWPELRLGVEDVPYYFSDGQNVGLVNGEASGGLVAVDMDVSEALKIDNWFLPDTVRSGREDTPGAHAWYQAPGAKTKKYQDTDGTVLLEERSDGCQTLVAPSVHPNGERYVWDLDGALTPIEVDAHELESRCAELATATVVARHMPPVGGRHEYAMAVIGYLMRRLGKEATLKITRAAWHAADADGADALQDLDGIANDTERRLSEGGNVYGAPALEEMVPGLPSLLARWRSWDSEDAAGGVGAADEGAPTHDELRDTWLEGKEEPVAYGQEEWRKYGAGVWNQVHDQVVYGQIDGVLEDAKCKGVRPSAGTRGSVERMARAKAFVPDERWDANEDILVCQNGTLEISNITLREHRPEDYALSAVPFAYDPEAEAPTWMRFLDSTVSDAAAFLQQFAGYSLTGETLAELAVWLYGPPGSGKSTFIEGLKAMLGARAGLLGLADIQRNRFALADLPGKTLVVATEQPSDYIRSTHVLNAIISGEEIPVERKFKDAFTVIPRAKICWAMNHFPRLKDANDGLFRRVQVVEFSEREEEDRDEAVKEAIKQEGAGILNWALEGLWDYRERGSFEIPKCVRAATEQFHLTNDVPRMFVEEACITSDAEGLKERASTLYEAYRHWCAVNGHKAQSKTAVSREWKRLGFEHAAPSQGYPCYGGIKVDPQWIAEQDNYPRSW